VTEAVLVHAIGRTPLSMLLLAGRLRRAGIRCHVFGYAAGFESFDRIATRLARRLRSVAARPYVAVGHSLGGVLLRAALNALPADVARPQHLFLLGSPSRTPRIARRLRRWWPYRLVHGDCGQLLADPGRMAALPLPGVPTTVVAGTRGWRGRWSPFASEENDGVVSVSEVQVRGLDLVRVPALHTFLMNSRDVFGLILARANG
jgi:hypothetical protein